MSGSTNESDLRERLSTGKLLRRLLLLALEYRRPCVAVVLMQVMLVALSLSTLGLTGLGIDYLQYCVLQNAEAPQWPFGLKPPATWSPMNVVALLSASIFVVASMTAGLKYLAAVASGALSQHILIRIRTEIYAKLQELSFCFYDAGESSSIINRAAGDANNVRNFIDGVIIRLITVVLTLTVYLVYMMQMHPLLTMACLATTPFLWASAVVFSALVQPAYRRASELGDVMIRTLVENLQGIQVVKAFAREAEQAEKFEVANHSIRDLKNSIFFRLSTFQPAMGMLTQINMLILIGYGGSLVVRGELALGAGLFVFANLLHEFANQVAHITNIANSIQSSLVSAERVFEVLDQPVTVQTPKDAIALPAIRRHIEFDRVSFGYRPELLVLKDISLRIEAGECIGVTGPAGAGKSTLISLLKRFYDVGSGSLRFDGNDVRRLELNDVRRVSGIVFQESFLFSNTIAANIAFGNPDASADQIQEAAVKAAAHEFISELPMQYETIIGEHGSNLSGGQRQRLALARALLMNPSLLLLDDATAAVDPETEHEIRRALEFTMRGRTSVIVSNRLSTLRQTDRIVVLNAGCIDAIGTHDELLKTCEYYRTLAKLQGISEEHVPQRRRLALAS